MRLQRLDRAVKRLIKPQHYGNSIERSAASALLCNQLLDFGELVIEAARALNCLDTSTVWPAAYGPFLTKVLDRCVDQPLRASVVPLQVHVVDRGSMRKFTQKLWLRTGEAEDCLIRITDSEQLRVGTLIKTQSLDESIESGGKILVLIDVNVWEPGDQDTLHPVIVLD